MRKPDKIYDVSWSKLVGWCTPYDFFKPKLFRWIRALVSVFDALHSDFKSFRKQIIFEIEVNGQVCRLRWGLNERFDIVQRRIRLLPGAGGNLVTVYADAANAPVHLPVYLGTGGVDFIIECPVSLKSIDADIKAFVELYKRPNKKFKVVYV